MNFIEKAKSEEDAENMNFDPAMKPPTGSVVFCMFVGFKPLMMRILPFAHIRGGLKVSQKPVFHTSCRRHIKFLIISTAPPKG